MLFVFAVGGVCVVSARFVYKCVCFVGHLLCDAMNAMFFVCWCLCVFVCVIQMFVLCVSYIVRCCEVCSWKLFFLFVVRVFACVCVWLI